MVAMVTSHASRRGRSMSFEGRRAATGAIVEGADVTENSSSAGDLRAPFCCPGTTPFFDRATAAVVLGSTAAQAAPLTRAAENWTRTRSPSRARNPRSRVGVLASFLQDSHDHCCGPRQRPRTTIMGGATERLHFGTDGAGVLSRASCAAADVPGAKACLVPRRQHQHAVAADAVRDGDARPHTNDGKHAALIGATPPRSPSPAASCAAADVPGAKACQVPSRQHQQAVAAGAVRDGDDPRPHTNDGKHVALIGATPPRSPSPAAADVPAAVVPGAKASLVPSRQPRQLEATARPQAIRRYDSDAPARWAAERGRYHPYGSRDRRCHAPGCKQALARARSLTAVCTTVGCAALVSVQAATRKARKAGRTTLAPGDGCASRACSGPNHRPAKHSARQQQMASAALQGKRLMVVMPTGTEDAGFQPLSARETDVAASRALEQPVLPTAGCSPARKPEPAARTRRLQVVLQSSQRVLHLRGGGDSTQGDEFCCAQQEAVGDFNEAAQMLRVVDGEPCSWQAVGMPSAGAPLPIARGATGLDLADGRVGSAGGSLVHS